MMDELIRQASLARRAAIELGAMGEAEKNEALQAMAEALVAHQDEILAANARDIETARKKGLSESFIERLTLNPKRVAAMADGLREVAALPDPVGELIEEFTRPNGLAVKKIRVPLGVIGIIFESRPNVTVDAAALCLKSGNAVILRGGSDAIHSNTALIRALQSVPIFPEGSVSLVMDTSRESANRLMTMNGYIDCLIPRGGQGLIDSVVRTASVPVIQTGTGICHVYVDRAADLEMARSIAVSAKISRPSVCNAAECLLVHADVAERFLPGCLEDLREKRVEIRGCERTARICPWVVPACDQDWDTEFLDLIYAVRVVDGLDEAIDFINAHGTRHSESIVTADTAAAARFMARVDAACVYHNASTRFTDGGEFGLGAEIGISTQKLHARGPMGLSSLTSWKYLINGSGQIR